MKICKNPISANCQNDRRISNHETDLDIILAIDNVKMGNESPDEDIQSAVRE